SLCGCFFFFQAEDGIRDWSVTGVQTCALPIWRRSRWRDRGRAAARPTSMPDRRGTSGSGVRTGRGRRTTARPPASLPRRGARPRSGKRRGGERGRIVGGGQSVKKGGDELRVRT